jgi:hypothetical protein
MLHGVRFIQSQLQARVAEFSLKGWLSTLKEQEFSNANITNHARKAHREAKLHCFLTGLAVAVEGQVPASGVVLVSTTQVPFALRVLSSLTPLWIEAEHRQEPANPSVSNARQLLQGATSALAEGVTVAWPTRTIARSHTEELIHMATAQGLPVVGATLTENSRANSTEPLDALLARRDVLVTFGTPLTGDEALGLVTTECANFATDVRARLRGTGCDWKPADANFVLNSRCQNATA